LTPKLSHLLELIERREQMMRLNAAQTLSSAADISLMVSGSNALPARYGRMGMAALP
jgi:hypothetical protein